MRSQISRWVEVKLIQDVRRTSNSKSSGSVSEGLESDGADVWTSGPNDDVGLSRRVSLLDVVIAQAPTRTRARLARDEHANCYGTRLYSLDNGVQVCFEP